MKFIRKHTEGPFIGEPKHSPGPWAVAKTDDGNFGIISKYGEWIARCYSPVDNARLIAAAPDMLGYLIERAEILFQRANEMSGLIDEAITWGSSGLNAQECLRETDEELSRLLEIIKATGVEVEI